jgi:hypothetical protein
LQPQHVGLRDVDSAGSPKQSSAQRLSSFAVLLDGVATLTCLLPARRATGIDARHVLRVGG